MSTATLSATSPSKPGAIAPRFGHPLFGAGALFKADPIKTFFDATNKCGDVARLRFPLPPFEAHIIRHPDHVHQVLTENARNYGKQTRGYVKLRELLGNGLVTSEGDFWKRQRRIAQPAFHRERISHFGDVMVRSANEMIDAWGPRLKQGEPIDVANEMMRVTLRIIGLTMLSTDIQGGQSQAVGAALDDVLHLVVQRIFQPFNLPSFIPTEGNRRFANSSGVLNGVVNRIIAERRAAGAGDDKGDLLSMLMSAKDPETGEGMSDQQLRDEVMTVFLAGHETTANALGWTLYLLSRHPEAARQARAEVETALGNRPATMADLPKLGYLEKVLFESMRLYPPIWSLARSANEEDAIGGYRIKKGSWVFMSPYLTQRDPRFWPNPEGFDPERFAPGEDQKRPKGAYFPFAIGPRKCIGESFALMEARLLLATILQRSELGLVPGYVEELDPTITLRPKKGIWMQGKLRA